MVFITIWVLFSLLQSYYMLTSNSDTGVINWESNTITSQLLVFTLQRCLLLALALLYFFFIKNILKYLKEGTIFTKGNIRLIRIVSVIYPFYAFLSDNLGYSFTQNETYSFVLTDTPFVSLLAFLIIGQLYKLAYEVAETEKLTI